jgi:Allene oxide cyclase barrel like domain
MHWSKAKRRYMATSVAALVGCAALIGIVSAPASTAQTAKATGNSCINLTYIEKLGTYYPGYTSPTGIGTYGTYLDQIFTADGKTQVASGVGTLDLLYKRQDGHIIEYTTEQYQFTDGTIVISDFYDRTNFIAKKWVAEYAKGTSGRYLGLTGEVKSVLLDFTPPSYPAIDKFVLCRNS